MRVRFISRDKWQKWFDVDPRLPPTWVVPGDMSAPSLFEPASTAYVAPPQRLFHHEYWATRGCPKEDVYVEDGGGLDLGDVLGFDVPSLHRERLLIDCLRDVQRALDETDPLIPGSALSEAVMAVHAVERIRTALHASRLGQHFKAMHQQGPDK